jgi:hypothetical protein
VALELASTLERVATSYPRGTAITERLSSSPTSMRIRPGLPCTGCAVLDIDVGGDGEVVYLGVGHDTVLDYGTGKRWIDPRFQSYLDATEQFAQAVIEGRVFSAANSMPRSPLGPFEALDATRWRRCFCAGRK